MRATLIYSSSGALSYASAGTLAQSLAPQLIAPEMMAGLKFNLNQPLGIWGNGYLAQSGIATNGIAQYRAAPASMPIPTTTGFCQATGANSGPTWASGGSSATSAGTVQLYSPVPNASASFSFDPAGNTVNATTATVTAGTCASVWPQSPLAAPPAGAISSAASVWPPAIQARQRMARYLYVLMAMLSEVFDTGASNPYPYPTTDPAVTPGPVAKELNTRRLAQWAINAVTFATNDSIMVPFKYDPYVFNTSGLAGWTPGWHLVDDKLLPVGTTGYPPGEVSQDAAGTFGVVWGCKPPALLLSETIAFHNRRVADTGWTAAAPNQNRYSKGPGSPPAPAVPYLEPSRVPQGSLFVELYCPRAAYNQAAPPDLYVATPNGWCSTSTGRRRRAAAFRHTRFGGSLSGKTRSRPRAATSNDVRSAS